MHLLSSYTNSTTTDNLPEDLFLNSIMTIESRKWANFKRHFVGPKMPRRIHKERREGNLAPSAKGNNINLTPHDNDIRNTWDRNAIHKKACPIWANKDIINNIYKTANELSDKTGIIYEVDHVIPVKHPLVCGLHVEHNLQIIPRANNRKKSNNFIVT